MNIKKENGNLEYYTIKIEADVPTVITYRVLASSPEEALERLQHASISEPPKPNLNKIRKKTAKVYKQGTLEIRASKKY
jgi:hypothetical protein